MKERKNWQKQKEVCLYVLGVVCLLYFVLSVVVFLFWRDTYLAHPNLFSWWMGLLCGGCTLPLLRILGRAQKLCLLLVVVVMLAAVFLAQRDALISIARQEIRAAFKPHICDLQRCCMKKLNCYQWERHQRAFPGVVKK